MKKLFSLITVLLILSAALFYQWIRTDGVLASLEGRKHYLNKELSFIDSVNSDFPAFEKENIKIEKQIAILQKYLPPEPREDIFVNKLEARFKESNIEMNFQSSNTIDKGFYQEIYLVFTYNADKLEESLLREIFMKINRLARWEVAGHDKVLKVTIYNSRLDMGMPEIKPCDNPGKDLMNYWPFNKMVQKSLNQVDEKCSRRNSNAAVLKKIKSYEYHRRLETLLSQIVIQLDPGTGKRMEIKERTESSFNLRGIN